jgi:hypothetical protein
MGAHAHPYPFDPVGTLGALFVAPAGLPGGSLSFMGVRQGERWCSGRLDPNGSTCGGVGPWDTGGLSL